jgi:hypothetical protein
VEKEACKFALSRAHRIWIISKVTHRGYVTNALYNGQRSRDGLVAGFNGSYAVQFQTRKNTDQITELPNEIVDMLFAIKAC